ncbi:MAG: iron ABC transporter permease [Chloroflexi bacterium]|nr:iron ABC transporter permease [Chloroflexota bacterium]
MQKAVISPASISVQPKTAAWRLPLPSKLQALAVVVVALVSLPLLYLLVRAAGASSETLAEIFSARTLTIAANSIALTLAVMLSAAAVGIPFAWLTTRCRLPLRRLWLVLALLPLVIPSYLGTMALIEALGPRGLLQGLLEPFGVRRLPPIYGFFGAWLTLTLFSYPYVMLPVRAALLNMDAALEEAAQSMGLRRWRVFWRVTFPQLRPALAAGMILAGLYTLSDFGAVALMRFDSFTRVIYTRYNSFDRDAAALLALLLIALTLVLLWLEKRVSASTRNYRIGVGVQRKLKPLRITRWLWPALVFCGFIIVLGVVLPVGILFSWLFTSVQLGADFDGLLHAALNTVGVSGAAALVVGLAALPVAVLVVRRPTPANRALAGAAYFGNVLPGVVVALALVFFAANALPVIYQTLPVLILGYSTRFLPLSIGATRSALTQINPRLEEAGRCLGLRPHEVAARITMPLARAGVLGGMALVFLSAMKELPTTLLLSPTGYETLPTAIWSAYNQARFTAVGAPALLLILVSALSLYFVLLRERPLAAENRQRCDDCKNATQCAAVRESR